MEGGLFVGDSFSGGMLGMNQERIVSSPTGSYIAGTGLIESVNVAVALEAFID